MQPPTTRAEFERRLHLLREKVRQGKFLIPKGMGLGLGKIRFLPNGRIDFLSVDELARLNANMMTQFENETIKSMADNCGNQDTPEDSTPEYTGMMPTE